MYKNLKSNNKFAEGNSIAIRLFSSALNVILRRERSELSRESRNKISLLLKETKCIAPRLFSVIFGLVPKILVQQWINLVNKLAILLHKYRFSLDCRNASGNDGCWGRLLSVCCSVFKYHSPAANASTSPAGGEVLKQVLLPQCAPDTTGFLSDVYKKSTRARKFLADGVQGGRNMIEMLGVLAIIAVLSVGGIAGYSKAMEKFKVNKASEEYAYLIRGLLEYLPNLKLNKASSQESLVEFALASNLIPPTWTTIHENKSLLDTYGNNINIFSRNDRLVVDLYLGFQTNPSYAGSVSVNFPAKLCVTLFENLVIPLKESLYYAYYINNPGIAYYFYGSNYCSKDRSCLSNLKLNKINELCSYCPADKSCGIILEF